METKALIARTVADAVAQAYPGVEVALDYEGLLEVPPDSKMGDFAFPCFKLSKSLRMGPPMIAKKLCEQIDVPALCHAEPVNGYLNFFLNRSNFARETLNAVMAAPESWGGGKDGEGKTVVLDYSSINIAKRFHIGHLSTTMIGHSLRRIYDFLGWKTVSINHLGDWGTQFGKMICAYKRWGNKEEVEREGVDGMVKLYVRFHEEAKSDPVLEDEGRAWFKRIEDGDPEAMAIFTWFKEVTLKDAMNTYKVLGVEFDSYAGESFYNDKMDRVVKELRDRELLVPSDGAQIVDLSEYKMPPCLILKSDGATIYATRDIAAALYRKDTYHFDKCLYVVAYQQDLHFRQVFKTIELMGYDWAKTELEHVSFGMVSYEGQTLSTREGRIVYLDELLARAQEKALAIINEKNPGLENKEEVARQVGVGAVIYSDLSASRIKDIDFWWDRALSFDGDTGPYVQYTYARCCSVMRKAAEIAAAPDFNALEDDEAQQILRLLARFPEDVRAACRTNEPFMITRAVTELAKAYNKFYYEHRILDGDEGACAARVMLTDAVRCVIRKGLYLIGMEAPERM